MPILFISLGIIANFAFVPFAKPYALIVAFVLFFYFLLQATNIKDAFYYGFFFGIGYFAFGSWWLFSIPNNTIATILFGSLVIILMALYYALAKKIEGSNDNNNIQQ